MKKILTFAAAAASLAAMATGAAAHPGHDATGFAHGFLHPLSGADHMLAMVAVGLLAAVLGGRARWLVPLSFMVMLAVGGAIGMAGIEVPLTEMMIAVSVVVLGAAVAFEWKAPLSLAMAMAGGFAVFHGVAHGAEMPAATSGVSYALGFVLATGLLHAAGLGLGLAVQRLGFNHRALQIAGAATAAAGVTLLAASR
jgi:urease accessory protein